MHDALGDAITLWVKRGDWYLIFYPGDHTDARLIIDSLACTLRYDLYYSTLLNVPAAPAETAAFLSRAISILDEGTATVGDRCGRCKAREQETCSFFTDTGRTGRRAGLSFAAVSACLRCKRVANNKHAPGSLPCGVTGKDA